MPERDPTMRTMKISEVKAQLSSLVNEVYREETRILVGKAGIPVAALVSARDLIRLEKFDYDWDEGTRALERFGNAFKDVPVEELEREVARAIAEVRAKRRAEQEQAAPES